MIEIPRQTEEERRADLEEMRSEVIASFERVAAGTALGDKLRKKARLSAQAFIADRRH